MMIRRVGIGHHTRMSAPAARQIKKQMVEDQAFSERGHSSRLRRVVKSLRQRLPGWLVGTQPGIEVPSNDARLARRERLNQRLGLPSTGGIARQQPFPP